MTQFVTAFDDIIIKRFNVNRKVEDRISVRYVYSPKQRVLYDIINLAQNMTLPAVAVTIGNISRDNNRVFNKLDGFYYSDGSNNKSAKLRSPVPINITVNMSIITRFQSDMDQILSNFVPYSNPYIVISWPVPTEFGLPSEQEIRSEVLWDGSIAMNYPTDLNGNEKARVIADTSFTIKGWLFKETTNPVGNIYYIKNNFFVESFLTSYQDMSGDTYSYPLSTGVYNENETVTVSATPTVTNMFYNGVLVDNNIPLVPGLTGNIILEGYNFDLLDGVLLSSNNSTIYQSVTSIKILGTQNTTISGQLLEFSVINKNILTFYVPALYPAFRSPNALVVFVPFNKAGFATTIDTYESF
jgi:hypothetical protein